jgi:hypothetical protein
MNIYGINILKSSAIRLSAALLFTFLLGLPSSGQTVAQDDIKAFDRFFVDKRSSVNCEESAWEAIHVSVRASLALHGLPESTIDSDNEQIIKIVNCRDTIVRQEIKMMEDLHNMIENKRTDDLTGIYFRWYTDLVVADGYALSAIMEFEAHKSETRYRALVARYNDLAGNVRSQTRLQPAALHCESRYDQFSKVTTLDCH